MNFFEFYDFSIKLTGFSFTKKTSPWWLYILHLTKLFFTIIVTGFSLIFTLTLTPFYQNLPDLVQTINFSTAFCLVICKSSVFFFGKKNIVKIVTSVDQNQPKFEKIGNFNQEKIIDKNVNIMKMFAKVYVICSASVPMSSCLISLVALILNGEKYNQIVVNSLNNTSKIYIQSLPYFLWIPFNYQESKHKYSWAVVHELICLTFSALTVAGSDIFFFLLLSYPSIHLQIVNGAFKTMNERCQKRLKACFPSNINLTSYDNPLLEREITMEMKKCIKYLQRIITFCLNLEELLFKVTLIQIVSSLIFLCTCFYMVTKENEDKKLLIGSIIYLLCSEGQIFVICFLSNQITYLCTQVSTSVYEMDWTGSSTAFQKNMIITMKRMQKPIHLTAGKLMLLTLPTFVTICKTAYQVFAVLQTMED